MHDLFPVRTILCSIFISGELHVLVFDRKSVDGCINA